MLREVREVPTMAARQLAENRSVIAALGERLRVADPPFIATCARGSSDHVATFAKYLFETVVRTPTASYAPSVSSVYGTAWTKLRGALFLAISQSGRSPDLVASARAARESGALVVALVNEVDSPLAENASITLPIGAGPELSVAATKSCVGAMLAVMQLAAAWSRDADLAGSAARSPEWLERALQADWTRAVSVLAAARSVFTIGRGLGFAVAQEAALKLKETGGIHAEAFSAAEVRHGPMAIVERGFPALMFVPNDAARDSFTALAHDLVQREAHVLAVGGEFAGASSLACEEGLHPAATAVSQLVSFYTLAEAVARARGRDPDRPPHLSKVTETR
jgi:glutamine---fructose-6-phosphate transaminase (isomerizing)